MNHAHFSRRQLIQASAATLGAASLGSLMAQPSAATTAALAALTGAERQKRLAEGAKKEVDARFLLVVQRESEKGEENRCFQ